MTQITGYRTDREGVFIVKDPQSELDYSMDWSDWMPDNDRIATSNWTVQTFADDDQPLTIVTTLLAGQINRTTVVLSGGDLDRNYRVTNTIVTDDGRIDERFFRIFARDRSA